MITFLFFGVISDQKKNCPTKFTSFVALYERKKVIKNEFIYFNYLKDSTFYIFDFRQNKREKTQYFVCENKFPQYIVDKPVDNVHN